MRNIRIGRPPTLRSLKTKNSGRNTRESRDRSGHRDVERHLPSTNFMRGPSMNEQEFQTKLAELMGEISTLPATERQKLERLADETRQRHERLRQTVSS